MRTGNRTAGILAVIVVATAALAAPAVAAPTPTTRAVSASGDFTADVDFSTLQPKPLPGGRCELTVQGVLTFSGTLDGAAAGTTTATVFAPCTDVLQDPPGTYRDTFRFEGTFNGTINGTDATGPLTYFGVTHPGGDIRAAVHLRSDKGRALLRADATLAVGGTYEGVAKLH